MADPMVASNVAVADKIIDAINARDVDGLLAIASEDIEFIPLRAVVEGTSYHGKAGVEKFFRDLGDVWVALRIDIEETREVTPGSVLATATIHGRGHTSDIPTKMPVGLVARIRDGLVYYAAVYTDRSEAERAAGAVRP
jgi:ketosteroid isomerase-like protein